MNPTHPVRAILLGLLWFGLSSLTFAQADTLHVHRHVFGVSYSVYKVPLDMKYARRVLYRDPESKPIFLKADIMTGASIVSLGVGVYLVADALKGVPAVEIGATGQETPYTIRSQKKFASGMVALLAAGCLSQYALDLKVKAVMRYNKRELQRSSMEIGYLSNHRIGFRINLP